MAEVWHPWRALAAEVKVRKVSFDEDGAWDPDQPAYIWLDSRLSQAGRRSTLTHELIHLERGDAAGCTSWHDRHQEQLVDRVAARRLIGMAELVDALLWSQDERELADTLWVDVATVKARLAGLTPGEKDEIERRIVAAESRMP